MEQKNTFSDGCRTTSEELKKRRYKEGFFDSIFSLFPIMNIMAIKYDLDVKKLLQLLLENIYYEIKIDNFIGEIRRFEEIGNPHSNRHALLHPTIREYIKNNSISQDIENRALDFLNVLAGMDILIAFTFNPFWEQEIFYIQNDSSVRFYNETDMKNKLENLLLKSDIDPFKMKEKMLTKYLLHKFFIAKNYDANHKLEVEIMLTRFYQLHLSEWC